MIYNILFKLALYTIYQLILLAKNEYGWGPLSSTFTFYNKGIGKIHPEFFQLIIENDLYHNAQLNIYNIINYS